MSLGQILALVQAGQVLLSAGLSTAAGIKAFFRTLQPGMSEADLNAILDTILAGAARHRDLAAADAAGLKP